VYLKEHDRSLLVFDHQALTIDEKRFETRDWSQYYPDAIEAIPPNAPAPRGASVVVSCFVDADHAGCRVTVTYWHHYLCAGSTNNVVFQMAKYCGIF
jgi:hypothetical protein